MSNRIKYCLYMNDLIKFYLLPNTIKGSPEKLATRFRIKKEHMNIMLSKYTKENVDAKGQGVYIKEKTPKLRNLYHILCICLLLKGYEMNFEILAKSLKMEKKKLATYLREMGCTITNDKSAKGTQNYAQLNAPLKFNYTVKKYHKRK